MKVEGILIIIIALIMGFVLSGIFNSNLIEGKKGSKISDYFKKKRGLFKEDIECRGAGSALDCTNCLYSKGRKYKYSYMFCRGTTPPFTPGYIPDPTPPGPSPPGCEDIVVRINDDNFIELVQNINYKDKLKCFDVSSVTYMSNPFLYDFNEDISGWNVSKVVSMSYMFGGCSIFNKPLSNWNVSEVTDMGGMFRDCTAFNRDLSNWNVSKVRHMEYMFLHCSAFNKPLNGWGEKVSSVISMSGMFSGCSAFNQDLSNWEVSSVTVMVNMFSFCSAFNKPLNGWGEHVSEVTDMSYMFYGCTAFNQNIGNWDVSSVTTMSAMFRDCTAFNGDISGWDVSSVTNMNDMFQGCIAFNQDLSNWNVSSVTSMIGMFSGCPKTVNIQNTIDKWIQNEIPVFNNIRDKYSYLGF